MQLTERRLRTLIRALLEADAPVAAGTAPSASPGQTGPDTPIEKTATEREAEETATGTSSPQFEDDLAAFLEKKMKDKGVSASSINDMKRTVTGGV